MKSFYTAGMLFDVLATFGEISEEVGPILEFSYFRLLKIKKKIFASCLRAILIYLKVEVSILIFLFQ